MQPIVCRTLPAKDMKRLNAHSGKTTDILSALFLLFALLLAGGQAPLTAKAGGVPATSPSPTDFGAGGHRSAPFISKQQFYAAEARDTKAAPWDDGKSKAFLPSKSLELATVSAGQPDGTRPVAIFPRIAPSGFDARAPPVRS